MCNFLIKATIFRYRQISSFSPDFAVSKYSRFKNYLHNLIFFYRFLCLKLHEIVNNFFLTIQIYEISALGENNLFYLFSHSWRKRMFRVSIKVPIWNIPLRFAIKCIFYEYQHFRIFFFLSMIILIFSKEFFYKIAMSKYRSYLYKRT